MLAGPKQLRKYLDAISDYKAGRNLGCFTTYYFSGVLYELKIRSNSNDGMIYYRHHGVEKVNQVLLLAVSSVAVILTGNFAGIGSLAKAGLLLI